MNKIIIILVCIFYSLNFNAQSKKDSFEIASKKNSEYSMKYEKEIDKLYSEIALIKSKQDGNINTLNWILGFLGTLLLGGFIVSVNASNKNESRSKELFDMYKIDKSNNDNRNNELYGMFLDDREKSEQTAIKTTETTIALVNRTLELAVQASERSSKSLQIRLSNILNSIEKESIELIKESKSFDDDRKLTTKRENQNEIHRLGNKIEGLENNLVILDQDGLDNSQVIKLSPYATFIKGIDQYLKEQFDDAIKTWTNLLESDFKCVDQEKLKSLTFYWIGYLHNNRGEFEDGLKNFEEAEKLCTDSRKYELQRMKVETRFFNNEDSTSIANELNDIITEINVDDTLKNKISIKKARLAKVLNTLGNVYYSSYGNTENQELKKTLLNQSKTTFLQVLNIEENENIIDKIAEIESEDKNKLKWDIYGLAESMYHIDEENKKIAIALFEKEVITLAEREYDTREEKRTKVLAKSCQLLCWQRINPNDKEKLENIRAMIEIPLSDLNDSLTIYSQILRRNIEYSEFKNQLKLVINNKI
jgi:hypothetical protein